MVRLPSVYLRKLDRADELDVWRVDGHRIRDRFDVDFTNGHHHFSRPYVPENEIWLDREARGAGEWQFWLVHQLVERAGMARGASYLTALRAASRAERDARRAASASGRDVRRRRLGRAASRAVWLVDGRAVRDRFYVDFTLGGHGFRYRFIPDDEIWIDDAVRRAERPAILHHEAVEVGLMGQGMSYDEAHARASTSEQRFRRRATVAAAR